MHEVAVEEGNGFVQLAIQVCLPGTLFIKAKIAQRDAFAGLSKQMQCIPPGTITLPHIAWLKLIQRWRAYTQRPLIQPLGILLMTLGISPRSHVEQDAGLPLLFPSRPGILQPKLCFAYARRAIHDGHRPRQQTAAEGGVQFWNARALPFHVRITCRRSK